MSVNPPHCNSSDFSRGIFKYIWKSNHVYEFWERAVIYNIWVFVRIKSRINRITQRDKNSVYKASSTNAGQTDKIHDSEWGNRQTARRPSFWHLSNSWPMTYFLTIDLHFDSLWVTLWRSHTVTLRRSHGRALTLSHGHALTLSHSHTLSLSLTHTHTLCLSVSLSASLCLSLSVSLSPSLLLRHLQFYGELYTALDKR